MRAKRDAPFHSVLHRSRLLLMTEDAIHSSFCLELQRLLKSQCGEREEEEGPAKCRIAVPEFPDLEREAHGCGPASTGGLMS